MTCSSYKTLELRREAGGVLHLSLNRPEVRNAHLAGNGGRVACQALAACRGQRGQREAHPRVGACAAPVAIFVPAPT